MKKIILALSSILILFACNKENIPLPNIVAPASELVNVTGPITLKSNVFVLDQSALSNLISYENKILKFNTLPSVRNARNTANSNLKVGDIIITGRHEKIPEGLLSKITSIAGNELILGNANLTDAFHDLNIDFEINYSLDKSFKKDSLIAISGSGQFTNFQKYQINISKSKLEKFTSKILSNQSMTVNAKVVGEFKTEKTNVFNLEDKTFTKFIPVNGYYIPFPVSVKSNLNIGYNINGKANYEENVLKYSSSSTTTNTYENGVWKDENIQNKPVEMGSTHFGEATGKHDYFANPDFLCFSYGVTLSGYGPSIFCKNDVEDENYFAKEFNATISHRRNETSNISNELLALTEGGRSDFTVSEGTYIEKFQKPPFGSCWFSGLKNSDGTYSLRIERNSKREFSKIYEGYEFNQEGYVTKIVDNLNKFLWKYEYDQNKLLSKVHWSYLDGTPISIEYYENGKYKNGIRKDGSIRAERIGNVYIQYTIGGSTLKRYFDNNGSIVGNETFDKSGKLVSSSISQIKYTAINNPAAIYYKGIDGFDHTGFLYNAEPFKLKENEESSLFGKLSYEYKFDSKGYPIEKITKNVNDVISSKMIFEYSCK